MNKKGVIKAGIFSFLVLSLIFAAFLSVFSSAVLDKEVYQLGENVKIDLRNTESYSLKIITPSTTYFKEGSSEEFIFKPLEAGDYTISVISGENSDNYNFQVISENYDASNSSEGYFEENDESVSIIEENSKEIVIGEPVRWEINRKVSESKKLRIKIPAQSYNVSVVSSDGSEVQFKSSKPLISDIISRITEDETVIDINLNEAIGEINISYETPAPASSEKIVNQMNKIIKVSSDVHYENVKVFTELPDTVELNKKDLIEVFWVNENTELSFDVFDLNNNGFIDKIEWNVPHLSEQEFNVTIKVLNVQSYPVVGGNWVVDFVTLGNADLRIKAVNETSWSNSNEDGDLKFLSLKCGNEIKNYEWSDGEVFVENYECGDTGHETSKVLTEGKHDLEFDFGGTKAYAHNFARTPPEVIMLRGARGNVDNKGVNELVNWTIQDQVNNSVFSHSTGVNPSRVTVLQSGLYRVNYGVTINQSGTNRYQAVGHALVDGANSGACYGSLYNRGSSGSQDGTASGGCVLNLTAGQNISFVVQRVSSGPSQSPTLRPERSWLHISKLNNPEVIALRSTVAGENFDSSDLDVTYNSVIANNGLFNYTSGSSQVQVLQSGLYRVSYGVGITQTTNTRASAFGKIQVRPSGGSFSDVAYGWSHANQRGSTTTRDAAVGASAILNLSALDTIKVVVGRNSSTNTGTQVRLINQTHLDIEYLGSSSNANVLMLRDAGGGVDLEIGALGAVNQTWDTTDSMGSDFSYVSDSETVQVLRTGIYHVAFGVYTERFVSEGGRFEWQTILIRNGNIENACRGSGYNRGDNAGDDSRTGGANSACLIQLNAGDNITIENLESSTNTGTVLTSANRVYLTMQSLNFDGAAPIVLVNSPLNQTYGPSVTFNVSLDEAGSFCDYTLNGGVTNFSMSSVNNLTYNSTQTGLAEGSHNVLFYCADTSGNLNNTARVYFSVDATPPSVNINSPEFENINYSFSFVTFNVSLDEAGSSCFYSLDDGLNNASMSSQNGIDYNSTSFVSDGQYTAVYYCRDLYNNLGTSSRIFGVDTTNPLIEFISPTLPNGTGASQDFIQANVSVVELNEANITFSLYNSTQGLVSGFTFSDGRRDVSWTLLSDGIYYYDVNVTDVVGNFNSTETRQIILDNVFPLIYYASGTPENNSYLSVDSIFVNVSVVELNEANITFSLYNSTSLVNESVFTDGSRMINWTDLDDGQYSFNVTITDVANQVNITSTRFVGIDTSFPLISFGDGTENSGQNFTRSNVYVNVSATISNEANISFKLFDDAGLVNESVFTDGSRSMNWTNIADGIYYYNVTVTSFSGLSNSTETRTIGLDNLGPVITINSPSPQTYANNESLLLDVNVNDAVTEEESCWWSLDGQANNSIICNSQAFFNTSDGPHTIIYYANDSLGNLRLSSVDFAVSTAGIVVNLEDPSDEAFLGSQVVNLNYTAVTDFGLDSCVLYGDWAGGWHANLTNSHEWWNPSYGYRRSVNVSVGANTPYNDYSGYTAEFNLDTQSLILAGQMLSNGNDLRIVYFNGSSYDELDADIRGLNTSGTSIRFSLQNNISLSSTDSSSYYVYYGNSDAENPQRNLDNVYLWYDNGSVDREADYTQGRIDESAHGGAWGNSITHSSNGYYSFDTADNFVDSFRPTGLSERDVYIEYEENNTNAYPNDMTSGPLVRWEGTGSGGTEASSHWYYYEMADSVFFGGYPSHDDITADDRGAVVVSNGALGDLPSGVWIKLGVASYGINPTNLAAWYDASPTSGEIGSFGISPRFSGTHDAASDNENSGQAGIWLQQDAGSFKNIVIRRYTSPEPSLNLNPEESFTGSFSVDVGEDGTFLWNVWCNTTLGQEAFASFNRTFTIDSLFPLIYFGNGTLANDSFVSQNFVYADINVTESSEANVTFSISNSSGLVNQDIYPAGTRNVTWSNLVDGEYYYNVSVVDLAGQVNSTETRTITLDTTPPGVMINSPQSSNYASQLILFNVTTGETALYCDYTLDSGENNFSMSSSNGFDFNASDILSDGLYVTRFYCADLLGNLNWTETVSFEIDSSAPLVEFILPTADNNSFLSQTFIETNVSVVEANEANITFILMNDTEILQENVFSNGRREVVWTLLPNGVYHYYVEVYDDGGLINSTEVRTATLDTILPVVDYSSGTPENGTYLSVNSVFVNVSVVEVNEANITFSLYNSTGAVNQSVFFDGTRQVNWTGLADGIYYYNVTVSDLASQVATTSTREIILDTGKPSVSFISPTLPNGTEVEAKSVFVNVSYQDVNFANMTFYIYNQTSLVNSSEHSAQVSEINWTGLSNANVTYSYYVNVTDLANNVGSSGIRTIKLIDRTPPSLVISSPQNTTYDFNVSIPLSFSVSDDNLRSCWYNINGGVNITLNNCQSANLNLADNQSYTLRLYANDSLGLVNSSSVTFSVDTTFVSLNTWVVQRGTVASVDGNSRVNLQTKVSPIRSFIVHTQRSSDSGPDSLLVMSSFINSTQISFENYASGSGAVVEWEVVSSPYLNVRRGITNFGTSASSINVSLPISFNRSKSFLIISTNLNSGTASSNPEGKWTGRFINSTTIQLRRGVTGTAGNVSWQAVEWDGASVQNGSFSISATSGSQSLSSPVNTSRAFLIFSSTANGGNSLNLNNIGGSLSGTSTVSFYRDSDDTGFMIADWFVVEAADLEVQRGSFSIGSSTPVDTTIPRTLINLTRAFHQSFWDSTGGGTTYANSVLTTALTSQTNLQAIKGTNSQTQDVSWQVIEFAERDSPKVNLLFPLRSFNFSSYNVSYFNYSASDESALLNCSLYGNWTGVFHRNKTSQNPAANQVNQFSSIITSGDGFYSWNVECRDVYGNVGRNSTNFTFSTFLFPDSPLLLNSSQNLDNGRGNITLFWSASNHSILYRIYSNSSLSGNFTLLGETTGTNFTDVNFSGNVRKFYRIDSFNPLGQNSSYNYFGSHVYTLRHNVNTRNWIGLPTNASYLSSADDFLNGVDNITAVTMWNELNQKRVTCNEFSCPTSLSCTDTNCNFDLDKGRSYEVNVNSSSPSQFNWSLTGIVYNPGNVTFVKNSTDFGKNWVSMYAGTRLVNASMFLTNVSRADFVAKWDSALQTSKGLLYNPFGSGFIGTNFIISMEEGYEVSVNQTVNWTQV